MPTSSKQKTTHMHAFRVSRASTRPQTPDKLLALRSISQFLVTAAERDRIASYRDDVLLQLDVGVAHLLHEKHLPVLHAHLPRQCQTLRPQRRVRWPARTGQAEPNLLLSHDVSAYFPQHQTERKKKGSHRRAHVHHATRTQEHTASAMCTEVESAYSTSSRDGRSPVEPRPSLKLNKSKRQRYKARLLLTEATTDRIARREFAAEQWHPRDYGTAEQQRKK